MVVSSCRKYGFTLDAMTCLSRRDPYKDIFKGVKKSHINKRWNFYNMVDIKDGMLVCQSESYRLDNICVYGIQSRNCTLDNTNNEVVELNLNL